MATGDKGKNKPLKSATVLLCTLLIAVCRQKTSTRLGRNPLRVSNTYLLQRSSRVQPERGISVYTLLISNKNSPTFGYLD